MPAAATGERRALIGLGVLLGLTYLTRFEAIWLGLTFAGLVVVASSRAADRWRTAFTRVAAVAAIAAVVAVPWWLRNLSVFGSPLPGQMADNVFLTRNEQIYSYLDRPSLDGFLAPGRSTDARQRGSRVLAQRRRRAARARGAGSRCRGAGDRRGRLAPPTASPRRPLRNPGSAARFGSAHPRRDERPVSCRNPVGHLRARIGTVAGRPDRGRRLRWRRVRGMARTQARLGASERLDGPGRADRADRAARSVPDHAPRHARRTPTSGPCSSSRARFLPP